jgi:heterotetrameric sarcosine oxidase gamma subunit
VSDGAVVARSPVRQEAPVRRHGDWEVSGAVTAGPLRLSDLSPLSKVVVRGEPGLLTGELVEAGRTRRGDDGNLLVGSGPDERLVLAKSGRGSRLADELAERLTPLSDGLLSVVDLTYGGVVFRLSGAQSNRVLEKLCAIDLSDRVTPDGSCFRSRVARLVCVVARDDVDGERSYLLSGDRSSGQYLFDALMDAGREFGIAVDGYPDGEL